LKGTCDRQPICVAYGDWSKRILFGDVATIGQGAESLMGRAGPCLGDEGERSSVTGNTSPRRHRSQRRKPAAGAKGRKHSWRPSCGLPLKHAGGRQVLKGKERDGPKAELIPPPREEWKEATPTPAIVVNKWRTLFLRNRRCRNVSGIHPARRQENSTPAVASGNQKQLPPEN